jgi:hypothetical protein
MINMLPNRSRNLKLLVEGLVLPAGKHRDGKQARWLVTRLVCTVNSRQLSLPESGRTSRGMHGDQVGPKTRCLATNCRHGGRDIVKFQIQEDALAKGTQGLNDLWSPGHK